MTRHHSRVDRGVVWLTTVLLAVVLGAGPSSAEGPPSGSEADASIAELTLAQTLELVQARNEEWEITDLQIERSREARREALAALLPQLSLSASVTRQGGEQVEIGNNVLRRRYDWGGATTASIVLFDGPRYPQYSRSGVLVELTEAEAVWRRKSILFDAESAFFALAATQRDVEIAENTVELRQAYLDQAQALMAAGMAISLDVSRARTLLLEAQQNLIEARAGLGNAADALAVLLGQEPETALRTRLNDATPQPPPEAIGAEELLAREDFEAQQLAIVAAEHAKQAIWMSLLPRLELRTTAQVGPPDTFATPDGFGWSASIGLTWLLYDGGARYARMRAADTEIQERRLNLVRDERRATAQQTSALRDWRASYAAVSVAEEQIQVAQEAFDVTVARFESGLATSLEVTDASQALFRAQITLNQLQLRTQLAGTRYRYLEPGK